MNFSMQKQAFLQLEGRPVEYQKKFGRNAVLKAMRLAGGGNSQRSQSVRVRILSMSRYDDIINLSHHVFPTRQRMSMHDRAAQFAPFAALIGHDDTVAETARLTEARPELDEQEQRAWHTPPTTQKDNRTFVSKTLFRMNTKAVVSLLRFQAKSKKYLPLMQPLS